MSDATTSDTPMSLGLTALLSPLFVEARAKGLWFYTRYHDLWFSPDHLEAAQREGRFRWGPPNWELRDPRERLLQLDRDALEARQAARDFRAALEADPSGSLVGPAEMERERPEGRPDASTTAAGNGVSGPLGARP